MTNAKQRLHDIMIRTAHELSSTAPDPGNWGGWVIYLLEALDDESDNLGRAADYELTLAGVQDAIHTRLRSSRW